MHCRVTPAQSVPTELAELAAVAAETFPLACPPSSSRQDVEAFIATNLSAQNFADYIADAQRTVLAARGEEQAILGYAMVVQGEIIDPDVTRAVDLRPAAELSKMYVLPQAHGGVVAAALMSEAVRSACASGAACVWLGVNQENLRAQRFYAKHGFGITGTKTFKLGNRIEHDFVMTRPCRLS